MELRLAEREWDRGMPAAWQFLHIDIAEKPDGVTGDVPQVLVDDEHFLGIAREPLEMPAYLNMVPQNNPEVLAGWSPSPDGDYGSLWLGAGQRRAVGRAVAMTRLAAIRSRIEETVTAMASDVNEFQGVARSFGVDAATAKTAPYVYLISSMGGGSGSGVFLDVSMLLTTMNIEHSTILYAPDIFDDLMSDRGMSRNSAKFAITGNTLAALSELVSAHENEGPLSDADSSVLALSGSDSVTTGRRTAKTHFFVGRKGMGNFELPDQNSVYHAVARALTAITVNGEISENLWNFVIQNATTLTPSETSLMREIDPRDEYIAAAMSFGYAVVTTGRQSFALYSSERLTRKLLDKLADDDSAVKKLRERETDTFLEKSRHFAELCGLREVKEGPTQISDSLRGGAQSRLRDLTTSIMQSIVDKWGKNEFAKMKPSDVQSRINTDFGGARSLALVSFQDQIVTRARTWATSVQPVVLENVVTSIVTNGFGMTLAFLEQIELDLSASIDDVRGHGTSLRNEIAGLIADAENALGTLQDKVRLVVGSDEVKANLEGRRKALSRDMESRVLSLASDLISDLVRDFLKPLMQELKRSRGQFQVDIEQKSAKEEWSDWATGPVPERLQPSENEVFLETTDTFASSFEGILQDSLNVDTPAHALELAVGEVFAGVFPGLETSPSELPNARLASLDERFTLQTRIVVNSRWVPNWSAFVGDLLGKDEKWSGEPFEEPSTASFKMTLVLDDLLRSAKVWTRQRVGFRNFSQMTMFEYLYESTPDSASRRVRFVEALSEAFQKSALMLRIDSDLLQAFTGATEISRWTYVTSLPAWLHTETGTRSSEGEAMMNVLTSLGGFSPTEAESHFDPKSIAREVEIVSFTQERVSPFALASVVAPIAKAWAQASLTPHDQAQFWQLRRARALPSFIPLAPSVQVRLAKGWIVGRLLNYVDQKSLRAYLDSNASSELRIYDPSSHGDGYHSFPRSLLNGGAAGVPISPDEAFPALIESLPLAYLTLANGSTEELSAYSRLAQLGMADGKNELKHWILTGESPLLRGHETCPVEAKDEWAQLTTSAVRADAVLENLKARAEGLEKYRDIVPSIAELDRLDRAWEFRESMQLAIDELEKDVAEAKVEASASNSDLDTA
jgi:hypothetical protein